MLAREPSLYKGPMVAGFEMHSGLLLTEHTTANIIRIFHSWKEASNSAHMLPRDGSPDETRKQSVKFKMAATFQDGLNCYAETLRFAINSHRPILSEQPRYQIIHFRLCGIQILNTERNQRFPCTKYCV